MKLFWGLILENSYSNVMRHLPFISVFVVQVQNLLLLSTRRFRWLFTLRDFIDWFQDAEAAAQDDVERVLKVTAEYKQRWNQAWEDQEKRLKQNLQICQFNYDLRQVSVWIKVSFTVLYILFGHVVLERYSTRWSICIQVAGLRTCLKLLYIARLKSMQKKK